MGISSIPKDIWEALKQLFNTDGFELWDKAEELIDWIWDQLKEKVLNTIGDIVEKVVDTILGALRAIWHAVTAPFRAICGWLLLNATLLNIVIKEPSKCYYPFYHQSFLVTLYCSIYGVAGPFTIIVFITVLGAIGMGLVWILKRLYELL